MQTDQELRETTPNRECSSNPAGAAAALALKNHNSAGVCGDGGRGGGRVNKFQALLVLLVQGPHLENPSAPGHCCAGSTVLTLALGE